jgi:hypothetical protein
VLPVPDDRAVVLFGIDPMKEIKKWPRTRKVIADNE